MKKLVTLFGLFGISFMLSVPALALGVRDIQKIVCLDQDGDGVVIFESTSYIDQQFTVESYAQNSWADLEVRQARSVYLDITGNILEMKSLSGAKLPGRLELSSDGINVGAQGVVGQDIFVTCAVSLK